ncbi:response regulator transcription factor [Sphingomonas sp. SRS2]|uniref:response regulator transcription factor n=1 Tax=Sphingomonas sp. SRS2 TaxID=133190 RepID=UPI0006183F12|nr:response regulator [Sphingomonas sp. SRS2]KKC27576.1 response regulator receiver protein [Sphingomonas sp. SRS2]
MTTKRILYVVDDEAIVRASITSLVEAHGDFECREYSSGDSFIASLDGHEPGCVVLDLQLEGLSGRAVMQALSRRSNRFRMIVITGFGDFTTAIEAFQAGAVDFLYKPYEMRPLLDAIDRGFHLLEHGVEPPLLVAEAKLRLSRLNPAEARVLAGLVAGQTNQDIAKAMGLEPRTVQVNRARALAAIEAPSVLAAIRTATVAGWPDAGSRWR